MIIKLSTPCKVFVTERIPSEGHTQVAPFRLASLQERSQKATQEVTYVKITTHNHKHLQ